MGEIADFVRSSEAAAVELSSCLNVFCPRNDKRSKRHISAGLIAKQSTFFHQVVTKLAEPETSRVVSEARSSEHAQPDIGIARSIAVTVLQAEADHPANHESHQFRIDEQSRRHDLSENVEDVEHIPIGRQGQINEFLDLQVPQ